MSQLKFISAPALAQYYEIRELLPYLSAQFYKEGVCMLLHSVGMPIAVVLIPDYDLAVEDVLG